MVKDSVEMRKDKRMNIDMCAVLWKWNVKMSDICPILFEASRCNGDL